MNSVSNYLLGQALTRAIGRRALGRSLCWSVVILAMVSFKICDLEAQVTIAHMQPDRAAPGMTIALEIMAPSAITGVFGSDGFNSPASLEFLNPKDTNRVVVGPLMVSWNGRLIQAPLIILPTATPGPLPFRVRVGMNLSSIDTFQIVKPSPAIVLTDGGTLGAGGSTGVLGASNTMVVDSIILTGGLLSGGEFQFNLVDSSASGNPRYLPVTILSMGPIRLDTALLSVNAYPTTGVAASINGGPGGGGGGHGFQGVGGDGFTGGGNDLDSASSIRNLGSGGSGTDSTGGISPTGVFGGHNDTQDNGGGGGTGCPYGTSGLNGAANDTSSNGGFGGGSAGGEFTTQTYGGGGGGFGTNGFSGQGFGSNGGHANGGRFLVPLQGGSGGGAGNSANQAPTNSSGGGGGGAISLVSFSTVILNDVWLSANGANGDSGIGTSAGGGGGSGGGVLIAPLRGISDISTTDITTNGGHGGHPGSLAGAGGKGGLGRIRIDGANACIGCTLSGTYVSGPSLAPIDSITSPSVIQFSGYDEDTLNLTDRLRIFYRDRHSLWQSSDVQRVNFGGHFVWFSPNVTTSDSELFVVVFAEVRSPSSSQAMYEPNWLLSNISIGRIRHVPSPVLHPLSDTIDFGCLKIDSCGSRSLLVTDLGQERLKLDSMKILNSTVFAPNPGNDTLIQPYSLDTLSFHFCPDATGDFSAILALYSGDTVVDVTLSGCGLAKDDRIQIQPAALDFGSVRVGTCDTLSFLVRAIGTDTSFIHFGTLDAPFELAHVSDTILLPPGDSVRETITFCPGDSGLFDISFFVDQDSILLTGQGIKSILHLEGNVFAGEVCLGNCDTAQEMVYNTGNASLRIDSIVGYDSRISELVRPSFIPPHDSDLIRWKLCPDSIGKLNERLIIYADGDTAQTSVSADMREFDLRTSVNDFGLVCLSNSVIDSAWLINRSSDTVVVLTSTLKSASEFLLTKNLAGQKALPRDSLAFPIEFRPSSAGTVVDSLLISVSNGICDTSFTLALHGSGILDSAVFLQRLLDFDSVLIGDCKEDTAVLEYLCGPTLTLSKISSQGPFAQLAPVGNPLILKEGEMDTIIFSFCPIQPGSDSMFLGFVNANGDSLKVHLEGTGYSMSKDTAITSHFAIPSTVAILDTSSFVSTLSLSSLSGVSNLDSVSGELHFDPNVLSLISASTVPGHTYSVHSAELNSGAYSLTISGNIQPGGLASFVWLPLAGSSDSTWVSFTRSSTSPTSTIISDSGFVRLSDCGNLSGNIQIAGNFSMAPPSPNPTGGVVVLNFQLGATGPVTLRVFNALGAEELRIFDGEVLIAGVHSLSVDLRNLGSGVHFIEVASLGWRQTSCVVLAK